MPYDYTKIQELLQIASTRGLTTKERGQVREQIDWYHAKKLSLLQQRLFEALEKRDTETLSPFEVNAYIHCYHKQSQELYIYIDSHSRSNDSLPGWLWLMDEDEQGRRVWRPRTRLPHEEQEEEEQEEEEEEEE